MKYLTTSNLKSAVLFSLAFVALLLLQAYSSQAQDRPNILWLVSEDNSPLIGAYGDDFATTPNIDKLAESGFLYTHAYANAPVCAPARNAIITGMYPNANGNQHMRSNYKAADVVQFFPQLLRDAGYYVTNNAKEDYNIDEEQTRGIWDESSQEAHYQDREPSQPFFAVFNNHQSHESGLHSLKPVEELRHNPDEVDLPPYLPGTPEIRREFAQYYDSMEDMDSWVGEKLKELEESGEAENTIVFYYGDHGGVYPRSKRFVYETGTRVPLIVRIPEKFRHLWPSEEPESEVNRLVSFVDLAPTLLSITGIPIPEFMQGHAFLGDQKTADPEYAFMLRGRMDERYDMSRSVRNERFRYIRNYMPYRIYGQHVDYLFRSSAMQSWQQTCSEGDCNDVQSKFWNTKPVEELYDTESDPWEVNNLADDPAYQDVLEEMRSANHEWMVEIKDTGFIPEIEYASRAGARSMYDYVRQEDVDIEEIIEIADMVTRATPEDIPELKTLLTSDDSVKRFWAATGFRVLGEDSRSAVEEIKTVTPNESSPSVLTVLSATLYQLGEATAARNGFEKVLQSPDQLTRTYVLKAIDSIGDDSEEVKDAVIEMAKRTNGLQWGNFDHRVAIYLLEKWGADMEDIGIEIEYGF